MSGSTRFLLLYGSQTGQARAVAEEIRDRALKRGLEPDLLCVSQSEKKFRLEQERVVVLVVSTTGDGDPPDTVSRFWRKLKRKTVAEDHLSSCHYALLGLGDSNYSNFCHMGKILHHRLLELGASQFYPPGFADDAVGLELVVEPWIDGLWEHLSQVLGVPDCHDNDATHLPPSSVGGQDRSKQKPIPASGSQSTSPRRRRLKSEPRAPVIQMKVFARTRTNSDGTESAPPTSPDDTRSVPPTLSDSAGPNSTALQDDPVPVFMPLLISDARPDSLPSSREDAKADGCVVVGQEGVPVQCGSSEGGPASLSTSTGNPREKALSSPQEVVDSDSLSLEHLALGIDGSLLWTQSAELRGRELSLPALPPEYIVVEASQGVELSREFPYQKVSNGRKSNISVATIVGTRTLTQEGSVKRVLEVEMSLESCPGLSYAPGDALACLCPNPAPEVDYVLARLGLGGGADTPLHLSILPTTVKKNPVLPQHIPNPCTAREFFTYCADIRCIPKKMLLVVLASMCFHGDEKRRLEELASRQGAKDYRELFLEQCCDFLDVLHQFPSCRPSLTRLIEALPRLQPRYYSAASSPLTTPHSLRVAFTVIELLPKRWLPGNQRRGISTGWFDRVTSGGGGRGVKVPLFPRPLNTFHLPPSLSSTPPHLPPSPSSAPPHLTPSHLIMIGPGTGVAPFIGFLHHLRAVQGGGRSEGVGVGVAKSVRTWLFFGCRHPDLDYIYREELEEFLAAGTLTRLSLAFSRCATPLRDGKYVQDAMACHGSELARWILEERATVYVCGDAANMSRDVRSALVTLIADFCTEQGCGLNAEEVLLQMREEGRYLLDVWS